jgi:beta-1,4-mannosyl-glycoprotein beta-1,4-N-acetylglucosaminyltransferase
MKPLVIDSFEFFQELDILEIRLNELYDIVDYFIISESTLSHTGKPKPLFYNINRNRFRRFSNKIIHQVIDDSPIDPKHIDPTKYKDDAHKKCIDIVIKEHAHLDPPYARDAFEKESLFRSMNFCSADDIILLSDVDEIPSADAVKFVRDSFDSNSIYNFEMNHYWFLLNLKRPDLWLGTTLLSYDNFVNKSYNKLRAERQGYIVKDAGWHFSFMGGGEMVRNKIQNYGEQSINRPYITMNTQEFIEDCIKNNHDFYMNPVNFTTTPILYETHPKYLVNNQDKFSRYIRKPQ